MPHLAVRGREPVMLPGQEFIPARPGGVSAIGGVGQQPGLPQPGAALTPVAAQTPLVPTPQTLTNLPAIGLPQVGVGGAGQAVPIQQPIAQAQGQDPTALINDTFTNILGRAPSAADIQFYQQQLAAGLSPEEFQAQIANSPEGLGRNTAPQTGLIGSEQALRGGLETSVEAIAASLGQAQGFIGQGVEGFQPFVGPGQDAARLQAAQSGALGPEAQAEAFANFQASPGQDFLRQEIERATLRNAAATGGLGGGNVLKRLQERALNLAQTDFGAQFQRLGDVSGRGLLAAGGAGNLLGLGAQTAQVGGQNIADLLTGAARDVSTGRIGAGQDIASAIAGTTTALSDLQLLGGEGAADIVATGAGAISDVIRTAGQGLADDQLQQLQLLVNTGLVTSQQMVSALLARGGKVEDPDKTFKDVLDSFDLGGQFVTGGGDVGGVASGIGALVASDIRLKTNIQKVGETEGGHNWYTWDWTDEALDIVGDQNPEGVIADEIRLTQPDIVIRGEDGFLRVDYTRVH